ncbi:hypothetical protein G6M50_02085 [Agrobacterium rhizogenes]|uniref:Uncharacterized protein n=2 Tax=unclassified Rhizobium TaxID=2613769 RepID=A0AAU7SK32_9HYPH|nr:hypothetical protein [Rhizobium rhizogenes]NTJ76582.1 hypothetical protein [Rhizobium rhizogenes]
MAHIIVRCSKTFEVADARAGEVNDPGTRAFFECDYLSFSSFIFDTTKRIAQLSPAYADIVPAVQSARPALAAVPSMSSSTPAWTMGRWSVR